ncbi:MAG: rhodanese-like domain-containing protein [Thermoplasmata archaeon]
MFENLRPAKVAEQLKEHPDAIVLLDIREPYERELASIQPSMHIPMSEVPGRMDEIPKDREVVVYCHGGSRSMMVAGFLASRGYRSVVNLDGGIDAWSVEVDPKVPRYD